MHIKPNYNPRCSLGTLDIFYIRQSILSALKRELANFSGTLLDVGCGYMPYKPLLLSPLTKVDRYLGLDLEKNEIYENRPDLVWDGNKIPLPDCMVECAIATEIFEHCPDPELTMSEIYRVLKPGGIMFFTVPFLWPLHDVPYDEYRYTPFSLKRHLGNSGFESIELKALGGWDASLAQMMGLWVRRRLSFSRKQRILRAILSPLVLPVVWLLTRLDTCPQNFSESSMITGIAGTVRKPST
jgi:SAM-dependent methyltransferase